MTSTPLPAPEPADSSAEHAGRAPALGGPSLGPAAWASRLGRLGLGLLILGALGLVAAIVTLAVVGGDGPGEYAASSAQYPPVVGEAEVTIEDQTVLGLFYNGAGSQGSPGGTCQVTDPHGEQMQRADAGIQSIGIDGTYYVGELAFETTGPGIYTVTCTETGYYAGPAYLSTEPGPALPRDAVGGAALMVGAALLLSALPAGPLLLAALIVRLAQGPRADSPARRRRERGLALLVVCGIGALSLAGLSALTLVTALLDPERAEIGGEPLTVVLLALPVLVALLLLAGVGALRRRGRGPRAASGGRGPGLADRR